MTANPNGRWITQQARNLLLVLGEQGRHLRFVLRDRDADGPIWVGGGAVTYVSGQAEL